MSPTCEHGSSLPHEDDNFLTGARIICPGPRSDLRDVDPDDMRAWHSALPAHLARAFTLDHVTIPPLRAALEHHAPAELARICTVGITRHTTNVRGLLLYRLRREAGLLDDQEETN